MKAKETREFLDKLNCEVCGYAKEMMEKGLCFYSCEDHFRLEETIDTELTELERLARIGIATKEFFRKYKRFYYDLDDGTGFLNTIASVKNLLKFMESEE